MTPILFRSIKSIRVCTDATRAWKPLFLRFESVFVLGTDAWVIYKFVLALLCQLGMVRFVWIVVSKSWIQASAERPPVLPYLSDISGFFLREWIVIATLLSREFVFFLIVFFAFKSIGHFLGQMSVTDFHSWVSINVQSLMGFFPLQ